MEKNAVNLQDMAHPETWDYEPGSPHLKHARLRSWMNGVIDAAVLEVLQRAGEVRVLEVGAGHGSFTDRLLALGATVTVTEMSSASARALEERYAFNPRAEIIFDDSGEGDQIAGRQFDIVLCVAVLHHIPDYLSAIDVWTGMLAPHGAFICFQDPLWYPRQSRRLRYFERASYYLWRFFQGDLRAGLHSVWRRSRGQFDEQNPRDMVEYHVLRQGCDEQAVFHQLEPGFVDVRIYRYWSTQLAWLQRLGDRLCLRSEFGTVAVDYSGGRRKLST